MKQKRLWFFLLLTIMSVSVFGVGAQGYSIDWSVIPGGGGTSSNGVYSVTGSIGQADVGNVMSGGNYSLTGGFWSLVSVVQTAGAPKLSITHSGNQIIISWPTPTSDWTLQQNSDLAANNGWSSSGYTISTNSGVSSITIPGPVGNLFFRLSQP